MKKLGILILIAFFNFIISCQNGPQNEAPTPSQEETIAYLKNHLTNGNKIANMNRFEKNEKFEVTNGKVTYVTRYIDPSDNVDWLISNNFSINDIEYISESTNGKKRNIVLNLRNKGNRRLWVSLNNNPIPFEDDEYIERVYIEPEMKDFAGLKKAFENLLHLKDKNMGAEFFDN